jgi:hypothetical protein
MAKITSYPSGTINLNDYLIGTDRENENVTRSYKVSEIVNTIIAAAPGAIGTVTSISTASSSYINVTGGPITVVGTVSANISATGTTSNTTFLRGDNTWSLPGPTPNSVSILYNGAVITSSVNSLDFVGSMIVTAANLSVTANVAGFAILVDSVIAGTAISVSSPTGGVTITNTGVTLAVAGGNVTLSGGTGNVTIGTIANAGTLSTVSSGLGIATITNSTTNPKIDLELTGVNNYISRSLDATVVLPEDLVEFNQLIASNVRNVEIGDITPSLLTAVKTYIDDADKNKIKNATDTYTSTEKALNMVSLSDAQYTVLNNGGTVNENTLYFVLGAGVSYTVNPSVTATITGDAGYTITTTPSSVSGVVGTSYTFTTTVNVQPGGSFVGTNPVITTDTINNASGNPYNKAITVTGVYTAPIANSIRASLVILLDQTASGSVAGSNLTSNAGNLTYSGNIAGNKNPLSYSEANPTFYSFTSAVAIADTNNYEFTTGPTVINATGSLIPSSVGQDVTVTTYMHGTVALKTYTVNLIVSNGITVTGTGAGIPTYTMDFESTGSQIQQSNITQAGGTISNAITGLNNANTFDFSLNNLNWALPADYTWSVAPTVVISANTSPIAGANGSATATVSGTILYTAPVGAQFRRLDTLAAIQSNVTGYANGNISEAIQEPGGSVAGTFQYIIPTITAKVGYFLTGGVVSLANVGSSGEITYNLTPWGFLGGNDNGGGLTSSDRAIENAVTVTTGEILQSKATIKVNCTASSRLGTTTFQTTFVAVDGDTDTLTTSSPSQTDTNAIFVIGTGSITVTVNRTSPGSSIHEGPGEIVWFLDGAPVGSTESFASGTSVSVSRTITGVTNGSTVLVTIEQEGQFRKLNATTVMNAAMSAYTSPGQYSLLNSEQAFQTLGNNDDTVTYTPTIVPATGYVLTGGVVDLSTVGTNGTVTYFSSDWAPNDASTDGTGKTVGSPAIENAVTVTTGTLTTETRRLDVTAYVATQITGPAEYTISSASQTINSAGLTTYEYTVPVVSPNADYTLSGGVINLSTVGTNGTVTFFVTPDQGGSGTALDPLIENNPDMTTGTITGIPYTVTLGYTNNITGDAANYTLSPVDGFAIEGIIGSAYDFGTITATAAADFQFTVGFNASYLSGLPLSGNMPSGGGVTTQELTGTIACIPYTVTLAYANSISGGTPGVEYTLSPADGSTRVGCVGTAYSFGTITATPASGYYFSTAFNATQTAFSLPINGTITSGGGTASQTLTGVIALDRATVEVVQVAVPVTTAITYATSFAPGGGGATRTLTTTGTQTLSNSSYQYGNGSVTVTVNRTAPSSTAQDGGSITWVLNGVTQSTQTFSNGATISYSRIITGVTAGDTIKVNISEG